MTIIIPLFILLGLGGAYLYYQTKTEPNAPSSEQEKLSVPSENLNEYTDGSGFSFSYPDNVEVRSNENSDETVYADLTLVSAQVDGSVTLQVSDTKIRSIDDWIKQSAKKESKTREIKLAGISGQEVNTEEGLVMGVSDQGILFTIEVDFKSQQDFWRSVYDTFLSTFAFSPPQDSQAGSTGGAATGADDIIFESEEIIE